MGYPGEELVEIETLRDSTRGSETKGAGTAGGDPDREDVPRGPEPFPLESLPDLAVRMYLWSCQQDTLDTGPAGGDVAGSLDRIPLEQFRAGLTAEGFLGLTEERFIREHVCPGCASSLRQRPDSFMVLLDRVRDARRFGTTFAALRAGLAIDPVRCARDRSQVSINPRSGGVHFRPAREGPSWASGPHGTDGDLGAAEAVASQPGDSAPNQFSCDGKYFQIVFHAASGRIERGTFQRKGNFGLAYYRYLIQNHGQGFTPIDIERGVGKYVDNPIDDPALDPTAWSGYLERLNEIDEELCRAERDCDYASVDRLHRERDEIGRQLRDAQHGGQAKGLDTTFKKARDRVRNAMKDALVKLHDEKMEGLREYLKRAVRYHDHRYAYEPKKASRDWLT
jgi:hypothetical protein